MPNPWGTSGNKMSENKKVKILGVIHARGGSKRIPLKNIKPLGGKPLIAWLVEAALESKLMDRVLVSTDHPEIKKYSLEYGAEVPFDRPEDISWDCPSELVTQHAVKFVEDGQGEEIDIAVTMQPTTPFLQGADIDSCINMLMNNPGWNSVFTSVLVQERPEWMFTFDESGEAKKMLAGLITGDVGVSQSLPPLATPNGGAYATRRQELFDKNVLISEKTGVHIMSWERSVDIDEPIDFEFAELMAKKLAEDK